MSWQALFLNPIAGNANRTTELFAALRPEAPVAESLMDSDEFAAFYQRWRARSGHTWRESRQTRLWPTI